VRSFEEGGNPLCRLGRGDLAHRKPPYRSNNFFFLPYVFATEVVSHFCRMFNRAIRGQRWMPKYLAAKADYPTTLEKKLLDLFTAITIFSWERTPSRLLIGRSMYTPESIRVPAIIKSSRRPDAETHTLSGAQVGTPILRP
jgi:hypothetical protein